MADILTPALGESVTEATIAKWTKAAGEPVKKDELLLELETDKVSLEVVSPADGTLSEIRFNVGDTVTPGAVLGVVSQGAAAAPKADAKPAKAAKAETPQVETPKADTPQAAAAAVDIPVPAMGESVTEGTMGAWRKTTGDVVAKDEMLVEIETDKVAIEVSAPAAGVLTIAAPAGAIVSPGQSLGSIVVTGEAPSPAASAA
ncbi:MAG: dihydrolipoamide succinyltransferase, partial [Caulobacterales bacterium]|nr:dihydrolipoamide succinyltransferase [Caulobacterales bacterium]